MSPPSRMCVWLSIRPGSTVEWLKSMTSAPAGIARPVPASRIRSPSIRMTALVRTVAPLPSIKRPQRMAMRRGAGVCAASKHAESRPAPKIRSAAEIEGRQRSFTVAELITTPLLDSAERRRGNRPAGLVLLQLKANDCLAELYFISRLQPDAACVLMHCSAQSVAEDPQATAARAIFARPVPAVIIKAILAGILAIQNVRMLARDGG